MPGLPFVFALKIRERVVALKAKLDALSLGIYVGHFFVRVEPVSLWGGLEVSGKISLNLRQ